MNTTSITNIHRIKSFVAPVAKLAAPTVALFLCAAAWPALAESAGANRAPELPSPACDSLNVPDGNKVSVHAYALGVQIYQWDGTKWVFVAPEARLYADPCYEGQIGIHYAGPTDRKSTRLNSSHIPLS